VVDPTNKVPFPYIGDAATPATLRFRTADMVALEKLYGLEFTTEIPSRLMQHSSECMVACLRAGLKDEGGRKPFKGVDYDDLPFGVSEVAGDIMDAISVAISGHSYAEIQERRRAETERGEDPQPGLEMAGSSSESSGPDTPAVF
jgi:hypothetical protein